MSSDGKEEEWYSKLTTLGKGGIEGVRGRLSNFKWTQSGQVSDEQKLDQ